MLTNDSLSFKHFLFDDRRNRALLFMSTIAVIIQISIFKYFYPFASYINGDSYVYIETAIKNLSINSYMVGYSMFIRAFSVFNSSDTALVVFQYLLLQASALFLLFTIFYFYRPIKIIQIILTCFIVFNPLFLYLANMVSSDVLFASLSLVWFAILLWIIYHPSTRLIIWHTLIIYFAFTVRYNALIYLLISAIAFMLSRQSVVRKITGIGASALLIGVFVLYTGNQYKKLTGTWQYSPFAGWLWANNAMYTYRYVDSARRKPVPEKFRKLDNSIRAYFDSTRDIKKFPIEAAMASTIYMWTSGLPLFKYRDSLFKGDSLSDELKKWASMGPFYKEYGLYIIKQYPLHFARYFLWPNANHYYAPPVEFLGSYNSGQDSVGLIAAKWFKYSDLRVTTRTKDKTITILDFYTILPGIINMVILFAILSFSMLGGWKQDTPFRKGILVGASVWLLNAGFTILASPAALRFQTFPILLTTIYSVLLIDWIWKMASAKENSTVSESFILNKALE